MPVDFPIDDTMEALRSRMKDLWDLPDYGPIPESGDEPVDIRDFPLPVGIIQLENEMEIGEVDASRGVAVMDVSSSFRVRCWLVRQKTKKERDVRHLRNLLITFAQSFYADRHLDETATWAKPVAMNWGVPIAESPFEVVEGESAQAGYVTVEILLVESTV